MQPDSAVSNHNDAIKKHQAIAPVAVGEVAKEMGIRITVEQLPLNVSGKLYKDVDTLSGWAISVNIGEPRQRQRFTIAHEIGHYVLHRDLLQNGVVDDTFFRSRLSNKIEAQANEFAADLLMPWSLIDDLLKEGCTTPESLAARLGVSQVAMNIRLGLPT